MIGRAAVLVWAGFLAAAPPLAAGEPPDPSVALALDAYIDAHAANGDFSGSVLVSRRGAVVYEKTVGLASRSFDVPLRPDTRYLVASVSKTFTAAAIALLQDRGKLKIEDGLDRYLPEFPHASKIKLWHLLAHQSGLANPDYEVIAAKNVTPAALVAMIGAQPLVFEPGAESRYSNAGYIVLARVVEKIAGRPFGEFLSENIFSRLGMTQSGTLRSGAIVRSLAEGYVPGVGDRFLRPQPEDPSALYGSGDAYSSAGDLDRWLTAIDRHELFDITKQPYPFGWGKRNWFDKQVLVQSGITNGYTAVILTVAAEELHVVALSNLQSGFTGDEGQTLLGIALGEPAPLPARRGAPAKVPRARLESYTGNYLWGEGRVPMHIESDGETLTLRWADSTAAAPLTPLSETEFLDRGSFGRIRFEGNGLVWIQNDEEIAAPRGGS